MSADGVFFKNKQKGRGHWPRPFVQSGFGNGETELLKFDRSAIIRFFADHGL